MKAVFHLPSGAVDDGTHALAGGESLFADDTVVLDGVELVVNGDAISRFIAGSVTVDHVDRLGR